MKTRPILFSGDMVRAILDGTKTQTRRIVTPQPEHRQVHEWKGKRLYDGEHRLWWWKDHWWDRLLDSRAERDELAALCPCGVPGDRLYVREAWAPVDFLAGGYELEEPQCVGYRATESARYCWHDDGQSDAEVYGWNWSMVKWRPSIHMPKWASRIALEVTDVRVERVQDISGPDARAEGVSYQAVDGRHNFHSSVAFAKLWDSINGKRPGCSWEANPWVWAVSYKVVKL